MKYYISCMAYLFMAFFALPAVASENHCGEMQVRISTTPGQHCVLTGSHLLHGNLLYGQSIPAVITEAPSSFVMHQSFFGPEVDLEYVCNQGERFHIRTRQDLCIMMAGNIHTQTDSPSVHVSVLQGSYFWGTHGTVTWVL